MTTWLERTDGYFFPRENFSSAIQSTLQRLALDGDAQIFDDGALIPFEKSVTLSEDDAELLNLPPRNPYQISIWAKSYVGAKDFCYVVDFLQGNGRPVVNPRINGALLHVGENLFRLNAEQFALIHLVTLGNEKLSPEKQWINFGQIQRQAVSAAAELQGYVSPENKKVIVADKLGVDFTDDGDGVTVQPVLLENRGGKFSPLDSTDFQEAFNARGNVRGTYTGRHGEKYIFTEINRDGLAQIKSVGKLSKTDAARYRLQPKELFAGDAFDFSYSDRVPSPNDSPPPINDVPDIEDLDTNYSDRVTGIEEIKIGAYQNANVFKIDWFDGEENFGDEEKFPTPEGSHERPKTFVLKIKENFEQVDYKKSSAARDGKFFIDVLRPDVKLLPHQIQGLWYMAQLWQHGRHGILLADDMGLGKTLQTLTFVAGLKKFCANFEAANHPVLIVAPTALLTNWRLEHEKFLRGDIFDAVIPLHGRELQKFFSGELTPNGKRKLLLDLPRNSLALTTYETLRDYQFSFAEIFWSCIVADEVQKIKNPDAGLTKALKAMKYDFAVCLSGTPVENSWVDLWSIMDFVQPAKLDDLKTFRGKFIERLTGDTDNIRRLGEELKNNLRPLFMRRMKSNHLPALPDKKVFRCFEEMPTYQAEIYTAALEKFRRGKFHSLELLQELRDISLHPDLPALSEEKFFELDADEIICRSARLKKTFALLDEIKSRGEKVLIFVTSRKMQSILRHLLEEKFGTEILPPVNGTQIGAKRQRIIDKFKNRSGFDVLILSPEAAGVGFTITAANNVIHLGRTWNPAKENQATDRVYRIGQSKTVNVYLPIARRKNFGVKTFDENLDTLLTYKNLLSENVLFPTETPDADIKTLTQMLTSPVVDEEISPRIWTIDDVDAVTGLVFEKIIADLYNVPKKFSAEKTPDTNDFGADVVVKSLTDNTGLLIQCKHTKDIDGATGNHGVQEIAAAVSYYSEKFGGRKFQPVVVTNAKNFSSGACELAKLNGVKLIARRELENLLVSGKILR